MVRLVILSAMASLAAAAPMPRGPSPSAKYTFHSSSHVLKATFSPDSKLIASGSYDKKVRIYTLKDFQERSAAQPQYTLDDAGKRIRSVAFSPDSKLFVSGPEGTKVWLFSTPSTPRRVSR